MMTDLFNDDFNSFVNNRLKTANENLECNDFYQSELSDLTDNTEALQKTLSPEQLKIYRLVEGEAFFTSTEEKKNAYKAGLIDGIRIALAY